MLTLYFSGTGNTGYIAEQASRKLNATCLSIEEDADFSLIMAEHDCVCVCYPIYSSRLPYIFSEFARRHMEAFKDKRVIIFVTQFLFSGDGARAFTDLFPKNHFSVIYAEHFLMPNNICNFALLPVRNGEELRGYIKKADRRIDKACKDIAASKIKRRGFNPFSRFIGLSQGLYAGKIIGRGKRSVAVDSSCTKCGACVRQCPMSNLVLTDMGLRHNNNCTICYRCVNACPKQAITAFLHKKPRRQYHGVGSLK